MLKGRNLQQSGNLMQKMWGGVGREEALCFPPPSPSPDHWPLLFAWPCCFDSPMTTQRAWHRLVDYERKTAQLWIQNSLRVSSDPFGGNCKSCTPKEMLMWGALSMRLPLLVIIMLLLLKKATFNSAPINHLSNDHLVDCSNLYFNWTNSLVFCHDLSIIKFFRIFKWIESNERYT